MINQQDNFDIIIDIHAHLGRQELPWMSEENPVVFIKHARQAGITLSVISHLGAIYSHDFHIQEKYNKDMLGYAEQYPELLVWWVVDPQNKRSIASAKKIAAHSRVVGFKVHPRLHKYFFAKYADIILSLAREVNLPVLSHCGNLGSMPLEMVCACNKYPDVRFIIAHFGNCANYSGHIQAMKRCTSSNVFVDTSSAVSIQRGIIEMGVKTLGVNRFIFGSDHPCYHPSAQCRRIIDAELPLNQRRTILSENAIKNILKTEQIQKLELVDDESHS